MKEAEEVKDDEMVKKSEDLKEAEDVKEADVEKDDAKGRGPVDRTVMYIRGGPDDLIVQS